MPIHSSFLNQFYQLKEILFFNVGKWSYLFLIVSHRENEALSTDTRLGRRARVRNSPGKTPACTLMVRGG